MRRICYKRGMLKNVILTVVSIGLGFSIFAGAKTEDVMSDLSKKYRNSPLVEMKVEKKVTSDLLGKTTSQNGKIFLSKDKFKWETFEPEKSLLLFDGTHIWTEQAPHKDFGGAIQVAKGKVDKKNSANILISSLFGGDLKKNFKVLKKTEEDNLVKLALQPSGDDLAVKDLNVVMDKSALVMKEISYSDDIGNKTQLEFSDIQFRKKANNKLFKYTPPKGAQVTEL